MSRFLIALIFLTCAAPPRPAEGKPRRSQDAPSAEARQLFVKAAATRLQAKNRQVESDFQAALAGKIKAEKDAVVEYTSAAVEAARVRRTLEEIESTVRELDQLIKAGQSQLVPLRQRLAQRRVQLRGQYQPLAAREQAAAAKLGAAEAERAKTEKDYRDSVRNRAGEFASLHSLSELWEAGRDARSWQALSTKISLVAFDLKVNSDVTVNSPAGAAVKYQHEGDTQVHTAGSTHFSLPVGYYYFWVSGGADPPPESRKLFALVGETESVTPAN